MGRLFLVEFDQTPEVNFYCCRLCRAHIVLSQDCFERLEELRAGFFSNVVNVVRDEPTHHRMEGESLVADIHCIRCNKPLGWTYIQSISPARPNGISLLKLARLLFWDGTMLLKADTRLDPTVDQEDQEDQSSDDNLDID